MPIYEFTCDFAKIEPPPPEMQQLIGAMRGNQEARIMAQAGVPAE